MKTTRALCSITVSALLFLFSATGSDAVLSAGELAQSVTLIAHDGSPVELEEQWGEGPVLLAFMAPRCLPCEESLPDLQTIARKYGASHGLDVLCVYLTDEGGLESVKEANAGRPNLSIFRDLLENGGFAAARAYGVLGTPTFILVGPDAIVQWTHVGRLPTVAAQGEQALSLMKSTRTSGPFPLVPGDRLVAQDAN
ncbi:MAG: TlpA disulfide reductase family protein [Deferrisomatales bacterium]|nr:TlpA disulfide reductase family protein [Deferrisomatales bacterium]